VTHTPAKSVQLQKSVLTVTEKNPGEFTLPGFYRLLPQLVGSCDPGGEHRGMGGRPDWPFNSNLSRAIFPRNVAAVQSLITVRGEHREAVRIHDDCFAVDEA
jgi:hypothetical protein